MEPWRRQRSARQDTSKSALPGQWLFYFIAAVGVIISLFLWYVFVLQSTANLKHIIQLQTEHVASDIDTQLELRISALKHMAKHLEKETVPSFNNWEEIVEILDDYQGFDGIVWINPSLETLRASPFDFTYNQMFTQLITQFSADIKNTSIQKQIWLSPLIENENKDEDVFVVVPLFDATGTSLGYLISIINLKDTLTVPLNHVDYAVSVYYDKQIIFQNKVGKISGEVPPFVTNLNLYGTRWKVYVQPSEHFISSLTSHLSMVALLLGIGIAVLFSITARLALLARHRARTLNEINFKLKNEIAERIQAEESKQKLEKALLQGQKMQAIGTLAGGIAHDFNNILYAIIGYVEMAREDVPEGSLVHANLGKVLEGSHRGRDLIGRILAFGRRQPHHEFHGVRLKATIENVLSLLKPTIPASVAINYTANIPDTYMIMGNETQLHQVMINLINNAVDSMDGDGIVNIKVNKVKPGEKLPIELPEIKTKDYCKIEVSDNGYGMDPTTVERIFEPFFTTKEVGRGTGLGLSIVHAIIEDHQGKIIVSSDMGQGTVFTIFFPAFSPISINGEKYG
jgi:signal transduction histidine kinase